MPCGKWTGKSAPQIQFCYQEHTSLPLIPVSSPFDCPLPAASPAPSATVAHPIPDAVTAAVGFKSYLNTWISTTPTPTPTGPPPPPPPPKYATGNCRVHITQYQKHEGDENPTGTYNIAAVIFDAKDHPIAELGQVPAPQEKWVEVLGLQYKFLITANATDDQSLVCNYHGLNFTMDGSTCGDKNIGAYDSGNRNMDCGFKC